MGSEKEVGGGGGSAILPPASKESFWLFLRCNAASIAHGGLGLRLLLYCTTLVLILAICKHIANP